MFSQKFHCPASVKVYFEEKAKSYHEGIYNVAIQLSTFI